MNTGDDGDDGDDDDKDDDDDYDKQNKDLQGCETEYGSMYMLRSSLLTHLDDNDNDDGDDDEDDDEGDDVFDYCGEQAGSLVIHAPAGRAE